ncbi:MAG: type II CRISPR RNA-guided endonuclease Cas9 [Putridiphycobacter sp.]
MKTILGLDLGTNSIGWALVKEDTQKKGHSEIIKLGVRVNPLTTDEQTDFEKGRPLSVNADRTLKRSARRNLQRFKLRRQHLIKVLKKHQIISDSTPLTEIGKNSTHETLTNRAKAANEKIELEDFAKVLLAINKKRGYKSSRKSVNEEEGVAVDGMAVAKELYENNLTPGQYVYNLLKENKKYTPQFYRSDLKQEFDKVWNFQKQFYPEILDEQLYLALQDQGQQNSRKRFLAIKGIYTAENKGKRDEVKLQHYKWRANSISKQLPIEEVAYILVEINNDLNKSSGYLGAISDRSKKLFFNKITVGQYLYNQIFENPHKPLKNQVFYRQDYLDEFEKIWETQAKYYPILNNELKAEIRDIIIFYQRRLKSQKHLISNCQFEKHHKAIPKSSPLFQEFKIWQNLNNLEFIHTQSKEKIIVSKLDEKIRQDLFDELNVRGDLKPKDLLNILTPHLELGKLKDWNCNYEKIEGNRTNQAIYAIYQEIAQAEGYGFNWERKSAQEINFELNAIFPEIGIIPEILNFNANINGSDFDQQKSYEFWHLLYSAEDDHNNISHEDKLIYGNSNVALKKKLHTKYGFKPEYAKWLVNIKLEKDYGSLSARAIRKILPFSQSGHEYSEACKLAGYNHSGSLTKDELENRVLKDVLELLPKNSLRNPVVEKILNQMVNLVNQIIETYGKPDEVRIELARELKKSAKERKETTQFINKRTKENEDIKKLISKEFGIPNPTKNDVIRYRLYEELKPLGYKTVFTNQYIPKEKLFSKEIDIEHIIPKALLFDDSFSNKTLAYRNINLKKSDRTAIDFIENDFKNDLEDYKKRVETLYEKGNGISKGKYKKLLMSQKNLPDGFIERDLRNTQYIAKKAKSMLLEVFKNVVPTTGSITDKLREDWDLINIMKELNFQKYEALGLTETEVRKNKKEVKVIKDWSKRNDHRHHAMDALTVAFTTHNHIQYLNNLNARKDETHRQHKIIRNIEANLKKDGKFIPPIHNFRTVAKDHIESILVSFKAKNKVVTKNINKTKLKGKDNYHSKVQLTPRGQLHKETVYGKSKQPMDKPVKVNKRMTQEQVENIIHPNIKKTVLEHLSKFNNNPTIAFDTKTLKKEPLLYKNEPIKEVNCFEDVYTIRKDISPDLKVEKVIDKKVKAVLKNRLKKFNNNAKEAFSNLDDDPIWLNEEKGISIKRVKISGVNNVEALHEKRYHKGNVILDGNNQPIPADFVSTGNNHHVAIYRDKNGKLHEKVVSFYEAIANVNANEPIINKTYNQDKGWQFLFTMKQNEMFVFPSEDFKPNEINLLDEKNTKEISKHLFRVQKIGSKDYWFRHHLETTVTQDLDFTYKRVRNPYSIEKIIKVRTNHLGQIVQVGEY